MEITVLPLFFRGNIGIVVDNNDGPMLLMAFLLKTNAAIMSKYQFKQKTETKTTTMWLILYEQFNSCS